MSGPRLDRVDILAVSEHGLTGGRAEGWTLRYALCRIQLGAAAAFAVRVHAEPYPVGCEQCAVAGLDVSDARSAHALFHRLVDGAVFPVHLRDVIHDAAQTSVAQPAAAMAPPAD